MGAHDKTLKLHEIEISIEKNENRLANEILTNLDNLIHLTESIDESVDVYNKKLEEMLNDLYLK